MRFDGEGKGGRDWRGVDKARMACRIGVLAWTPQLGFEIFGVDQVFPFSWEGVRWW
jgi:hypothetical protein